MIKVQEYIWEMLSLMNKEKKNQFGLITKCQIKLWMMNQIHRIESKRIKKKAMLDANMNSELDSEEQIFEEKREKAIQNRYDINLDVDDENDK